MDWLTFFERLIANAAWPLVVLFAIHAFRKHIGPLISRVSNLKSPLVEASFERGQQQNSEYESKIDEAVIAKMTLKDETGLRDDIEKKINNSMSEVASDAAKIQVLTRNLAHSITYARTYYVYSVIFGSQIKLLERLRTAGIDGISAFEAFSFYREAASLNPGVYPAYTFDEYSRFMIDQSLVEVADSKWKITKHGLGLLAFIEASGLSKDRVG